MDAGAIDGIAIGAASPLSDLLGFLLAHDNAGQLGGTNHVGQRGEFEHGFLFEQFFPQGGHVDVLHRGVCFERHHSGKT